MNDERDVEFVTSERAAEPEPGDTVVWFAPPKPPASREIPGAAPATA
ncbi:MAG: hypothetical protein U5K76_00080 [Woeseiaceae bacterium]|nr:hypothetical protein [Woeseiaceae bacterium]